jgi:glutamyl-tRNA synthetase
MTDLRTRFAPSPTGFLHIGGARTALFNWAYARRHGGRFVLRVEDTDRERSTLAAEEALIEGLRWLGLDWDEGPFRQSERRERYATAVEKLLAAGRAYRCTCTREELEERKQATIAAGGKWTYDGRCRDAEHGPDSPPHTVRLRLPAEGHLGWDDLVFGPSGQDASEIGDAIIQRSDGVPLFHLAVVVDDHEMGITHVIRGADHHNNTPLQIALYRALDTEPPRFGHVPLIVGPAGKKLSKRVDDVSVQQFRQHGYLDDAMRNWLVRIGWSHGDQEIFSAEEITRLFDLDTVGRKSAQADPGKLDWLNQHYITGMPREPLVNALLPFLAERVGHPVEASAPLGGLVDLLRERSKTLVEMAERAAWLVSDEIELDEKAAQKHLSESAAPILRDLRVGLDALEEWDPASLEPVFEAVRERHDVGMGKLAQPVRVAVTGSAASPGIYETLAVLGREKTLARLEAALAHIDSAS